MSKLRFLNLLILIKPCGRDYKQIKSRMNSSGSILMSPMHFKVFNVRSLQFCFENFKLTLILTQELK